MIRRLSMTLFAFMFYLAICSAADETPIFDVPHLDNIVIDGKPDDWGNNGLKVELLIPPQGDIKTTGDFDGQIRLGWDKRGLLLLAEAQDDAWFESDKIDQLWRNDGMEVFLSPKKGNNNVCQWVITPGMSKGQPELRWHFHDSRKDPKLKVLPADMEIARTKTGKGYVIEALLPWKSLDLQPKNGDEVAFQFWFNDDDSGDGRQKYNAAWYPGLGPHFNPENLNRIRLADQTGEPVSVRMSGFYDVESLHTIINVVAKTGNEVTAVLDGKTVGSGKLVPDGRVVKARLVLPLPSADQDWRKLSVMIDGKSAGIVEFPELAPMRQVAFEKAEMDFSPFVFSGTKFPSVDFRRPLLVEGLAGEYQIKTTFYDAGYNVVKQAEKPGRYGAIVEVDSTSGMKMKKFFTLYRQPEPVNWWKEKMPVSIELPKQLGIDPAVAKEQCETISDFLKWQLRSSFDTNPDSAVVLAGLSEIRPGELVTSRNSPWSRNEWWWFKLKQKTGNVVPLKYWSYVPQEAAKEPGKKWPAILFLHGAGERGDKIEKVISHGPPKLINQGKKLPFIVIAPQCPAGEWWTAPELDHFLNNCLKEFPVDPDRLYLTGLSMGGFGSWALATEFPNRFAAVAPICGRGDPKDVKRLENTPIWIFHGAKDPTVSVEGSREMFEALKKVNGRVKYTEYPEAGHDSWSASYNRDELYDWLLRQVRGKPEQGRTAEGETPEIAK